MTAEAPGQPGLPVPGWYPDPAGRHHFRYWDGVRWSDLVSTAGVSGVDPGTPSQPSPAQPGPAATAPPDLIVVTAEEDGGYRLATVSGVELGSAPPAEHGDEVVLRTPEGAIGAVLKLGSRQVVVARDGTGTEIGRFEPAPGGGLRLLSRGSLAGRLVSWPDGTFGMVDPDENPLARFTFGKRSTSVETAAGLAPAIAHLAVLVPIALSLANRMPATPGSWA